MRSLAAACLVVIVPGCKSDKSPAPDKAAENADIDTAVPPPSTAEYAGVLAAIEKPAGIAEMSPEKILSDVCGRCHKSTRLGEEPVVRIPTVEHLSKIPTFLITATLKQGSMRLIGQMLTEAQQVGVAELITNEEYYEPQAVLDSCDAGTVGSISFAGPRWGHDPTNRRFVSGKHAGLSVEEIPNLKLKWVRPLVGVRMGSPLQTLGDHLFVGDLSSNYAFHTKTGCLVWQQPVVVDGEQANLTSGPLVIPNSSHPERSILYYAALSSWLFGSEVSTGKIAWKQKLPSEKGSDYARDIQSYKDLLFLGRTAGPESHFYSADPNYECCKVRGAVLAFNAETGKLGWTGHTMPEPQPTIKSKVGTQLWGPSGASVWQRVTIDSKLQRVYAPTGQNSTPPATDTSDAIVAFDMKSGERIWSKRLWSKDDIWNAQCHPGDASSCPFEIGFGYDTSSPALVELPSGKRLLIGVNKSGAVRAMDPDNNGATVWETKIQDGFLHGAGHWGIAADNDKVYIPFSRRLTKEWKPTGLDGALVALRLEDGSEAWRVTPPKDSCKDKGPNCEPGFSSPPTVIPGAVFVGGLDGHVRAYSTETGNVLWDYDTARKHRFGEFAVGGGAIDGPGGIAVVNGMLFLTSGYGFLDQMPGNALLAFGIDSTE